MSAVIGLTALARAAEPVLRAGADRTDITPFLGTSSPGSFNAARGVMSIHDPLHARSLVLDDGARRIAFVVCDNVALPRSVCDEAKRRIARQSKLDAGHVLIAATHTHSGGDAWRSRGPEITDVLDFDGFTSSTAPLSPYQDFLAQRIADSVQNAIGRLAPARIGWGAGRLAEELFNRRWFVKSELNRRNPFGGVDQVRMNPTPATDDLIKPAGQTDPEIVFISIQTLDGRPLAVLANYSLHYVGGTTPLTFSADYYGVFAQRLAELLNAEHGDPPFVAIMSNGTSGDVNNRDFPRGPVNLPPFEKIRRVGNSVAAEVYRVYQNLTYKSWAKIDVRYEEMELEPRRATPGMIAFAHRALARPADETPWHPLEKIFARWVLQSQVTPDVVRVPVQAFRIGELGIVAAPVEIFAEMGLELKARSPMAKSFTISLANGWFGYLPTPAQHELAGYESWFGVNRLEPQAAPKIVARWLSQLESMKP